MYRTRPACTLVLLAAAATISAERPHAAADSPYLTPPRAIVDILEASPTPTLLISPTRERIALLERKSMPSIADVARPMLRLAGLRIDPRTNGLHQPGGIVAITFKDIAGGADRRVTPPAGASIQSAAFSPDGRQFAFTIAGDRGIELWVADPVTGQARAVTSRSLNAVTARAFQWMPDGQTLLCLFVPEGRGRAPELPAVPEGPNIQEGSGRAAPRATYEDLLETAHDEDVFEYYATAQLALVATASGNTRSIGKPGIFVTIESSPNGEFLLVARIKRPFSRLIPLSGFPKDVEVWNQQGGVLQRIADLPAAEGVPILGVPTGPRAYQWKPTEPAALVWAEALDEGDLRKKAAHRDKLVRLSAPFSDDAKEFARTEHRFSSVSWTEKGLGLVTESERERRRVVTWVVDGAAPPRKLWDRSQQDRYGDPGTPVTRLVNGKPVVIQRDNSIYLSGAGASPSGDRPFLDRLDLNSRASQRVFQTGEKSYETIVGLLADDGSSVLTRYETPEEPPNYFVRGIGSGERRPLTSFTDPAPQLRGLSKQLVTYQRKDGVKLSGTLYLPPGYRPGQRLPMVMWAYPQEFVDLDTASQVVGSPNRFTTIGGASHLLLLTQGYAVFDNPTMPIVGPGETANDTYVDQLVASAEAAVDKVVEMGVATRDRIGIGGHSYGAFMTANLLAHSDLFRAGIARSGAYNRTLTPFGFQNERRTFWEVPQIYTRMSPFFYANRINEPILLIHGEADDNSGTFPIQSERLFMALQGHGATVRYVTLPNEAHGYAARESVLHTVAEMLNWMDKYVKNAGPRRTGETAAR